MELCVRKCGIVNVALLYYQGKYPINTAGVVESNMGLCRDIICFLTFVYLAVLLKLGFLLQLCKESVRTLYACTQPITIFQLMSGERREIGGISIGFYLFKNYPHLFFLRLSSTKAYNYKQAGRFCEDQKSMLVIFPFAVDIKASCLNDASFHGV